MSQDNDMSLCRLVVHYHCAHDTLDDHYPLINSLPYLKTNFAFPAMIKGLVTLVGIIESQAIYERMFNGLHFMFPSRSSIPYWNQREVSHVMLIRVPKDARPILNNVTEYDIMQQLAQGGGS